MNFQKFSAPVRMICPPTANSGVEVRRGRRAPLLAISTPTCNSGRTPVMRTPLKSLLLTGAILAPSIARGAPSYSVIDIGLLPGFVSSTATSVDNSGEIVG